MSTTPAVLRDAEFDPAVRKYYMCSVIMSCAGSIIGIPLIPIAWIIGKIMIDKYLDRLSCTLTERTLEVRKGILNRVQSTIPLEKITDLQMFQGPLMRYLGLHGFKVETAGQTTSGGALLSIVGIVDAEDFREQVLAQRDRRSGGESGARTADALGGGASAASAAASPELVAVLGEIRDAVVRIEQRLDERSGD